ncbi:hypothetical protein CBL_09482 [Carabus blaptoides fortunei]
MKRLMTENPRRRAELFSSSQKALRFHKLRSRFTASERQIASFQAHQLKSSLNKGDMTRRVRNVPHTLPFQSRSQRAAHTHTNIKPIRPPYILLLPLNPLSFAVFAAYDLFSRI